MKGNDWPQFPFTDDNSNIALWGTYCTGETCALSRLLVMMAEKYAKGAHLIFEQAVVVLERQKRNFKGLGGGNRQVEAGNLRIILAHVPTNTEIFFALGIRNRR